ncbi:MAG: carboxylesterase/lipase family protein [Myxococcaceae bacterium]|nr:carboxylesterase/lipase family protein [Myxococcaceae bacterium]
MRALLLLALFTTGFFTSACRTVRPAWAVQPQLNITSRHTNEGDVVGGAGKLGGHAWLGIPFAEPPVGDLRWRAPRPPSLRDFPLAATQFSRACVQPANRLTINETEHDGVFGSEDCLYLNIWAPEVAKNLPVMVWIHGGGNSIGSAAQYDLSRLATQENVIAVSVQYRLGPLGWFRHSALREGATEDDASGNYGTLDLVRALEWVRDNIAAFGGDPNAVTIFGESAGGTNVYSLLVSPKAKGLFHRAIAQSPSISRYTLASAEDLDGHPNSSNEVLSRIWSTRGARDRQDGLEKIKLTPREAVAAVWRGLPAHEVIRLYVEGAPVTAGMLDVPILFPDGAVLPKEGWVSVFATPGGWNAVPVITGSNRDEAKLFQLFDKRHTYYLLGFLPRMRDEQRYEAQASAVSRLWRGATVDAVAKAMRASGHEDVWSYRFDWDDEPTKLGTELGKLLGAAHGIEIPFVFGDFEGQELLYELEDNTQRDLLVTRMMDHWGNFAHAGKPGSEWLRYDPSSASAPKYLTLDTPVERVKMSSTVEDPEAVLQELLAARDTLWADKCDGLSRLVKIGFVEPERAARVYECKTGSDPVSPDTQGTSPVP